LMVSFGGLGCRSPRMHTRTNVDAQMMTVVGASLPSTPRTLAQKP
jgi:hypothetical protein